MVPGLFSFTYVLGEHARVVYTVVYTYTMATLNFPDIYANALGFVALQFGNIYQANSLWPYNILQL